MRSRTPLFALLLVTISLALPLAAHAAIPFFGPIIDPKIMDPTCPLGWGAVMIVINNIISFLITIAIVFVAPVMIAYAGFLYVVNPVDPSGISKAKGILLHTITGIVIALAGWLIVNAVMAVLYNGSFGSWSSIVTSGGAPQCLTQAAATTEPSPVVTVVPPAVNCATSYTSNLPGITVSSTDGCCDKTKKTCTSLDGMSYNTIQQILNIKNKCGAITVTGGTEVGHASEGGAGSHSSGSKVDIGQNLISCISGTTGSSPVNPPSFGTAQVKDRWGNIYTWEGNHTDVYVKSDGVL